ncbi:MAG TPA: hypothetical protein VF097_02675 [Actinomycetota bacterium]
MSPTPLGWRSLRQTSRRSERPGRLLGLTLTVVLLSFACTGGLVVAPGGTPPATRGEFAELPGSFVLIGQEPLFERGMNAGLAVWRDFAYVGNRTDGSSGHPHPGILVVTVEDPGAPEVVGEIRRLHVADPGATSRELRIWPGGELLIALTFGCDAVLHGCAPDLVRPSFSFYDIGGDRAARPRFVSEYQPQGQPHKFYLWQDPRDRGRALLFVSTPTPIGENLLVVDISGARSGRVRELATWSAEFPDPGPDDALHSLSVSIDGRRAYLAHLTAGFLILDTSELARGAEEPQIRTITPLDQPARWPGVGPHSAVKVPGRDLVLTTDEVYGRSAGGGCPWGWGRLISIAEETSPEVISEFGVSPYNDLSYCEGVSSERDAAASFSSHNPTVTEHLALISWHGAGLQAFSTEDPAAPERVAEFLPDPLLTVATEDPPLSSGPDKVVMWSYPIILNGLIYVVDVRNGLYVLEYEGPFDEELAEVSFLEGNSNLGDASP